MNNQVVEKNKIDREARCVLQNGICVRSYVYFEEIHHTFFLLW